MANFNIKVVFDRKKTATAAKKAAVQIQVNYDGQQWFFAADVHVFKNQWDKTRQRVRNSMMQDEYNALIDEKVNNLLAYYKKCVGGHITPQKDDARNAMNGKDGSNESFIAYMARRIEERTDIKKSTKKQHRNQLKTLKEYGEIKWMSDLNYQNVVYYNEWLQRKYGNQGTVWTKLKTVKHYVIEAFKFGLIPDNPFKLFKMDKGDSEGANILEYEDYLKIVNAKIPESLEKVRDIMRVQFMTGLDFIDFKQVDFNNLERVGEYDMLVGKREKSGVPYYIPILNDTKEILAKYNGVLPFMSDNNLNTRYRIIADAAGVGYHISSKSLRKGLGTYLINKNVALPVIAKVMGHSNTKITEKIYAKLKKETIAKGVAGL